MGSGWCVCFISLGVIIFLDNISWTKTTRSWTWLLFCLLPVVDELCSRNLNEMALLIRPHLHKTMPASVICHCASALFSLNSNNWPALVYVCHTKYSYGSLETLASLLCYCLVYPSRVFEASGNGSISASIQWKVRKLPGGWGSVSQSPTQTAGSLLILM